MTRRQIKNKLHSCAMKSNPSNRKAVELNKRDELILSVAHGLLVKHGLSGFSMQNIADECGYSKGTIYQHYTCKEDLVLILVTTIGKSLVGMIELAISNGTSLRHKVALVSAAVFIHGERHPEMMALAAKIRSPEFVAKLSERSQTQLSRNNETIFKGVLTIFSQGSGFDSQKIMDALFGWWTMLWGVQDVLINDTEISEVGFPNPIQSFFRSINIYLNGLGVPEDSVYDNWSDIKEQAECIFDLEHINKNKE